MTRLNETTEDVFVELIDFKNSASREMLTLNDDGSYTIFVNARLTTEGQASAVDHARKHITNDDFQKSDIQEIEYEAHKEV